MAKQTRNNEKRMLEAQVSKDDPAEVFQMLDIIGTGSYGTVYTCRNMANNKIQAIKFLEVDSEDQDVVDIVREIDIMKESIECPYIVEYTGCYMKEGVLMIVMEYCCCSLEDILDYCPKYKWKEIEIAAICAAVVKGLVYLHEHGIAHRDIKSGNVLLTELGEAKLADFGISHKLKHDKDKMKTMIGSPYWLAPEIITADSYTNKVDIWALAITAIEIAESKPPHFDIEPAKVIFHIPKQPPPRLQDETKWTPEFPDFLDKCLKKDPTERSTAKELLNHPFILKGSSWQILQPLVQQCLPILLPKKADDLRQDLEEDDKASLFTQKGTILRLDKKTKVATVIEK